MIKFSKQINFKMDSEEIEEQFNLSKTEVFESDEFIPSDLEDDGLENLTKIKILDELESEITKNLKNNVEIWRVTLAFSLFSLGCYLFYLFLPIEFVTREILWQIYYKKCCFNIYNDFRCLLNNNCKFGFEN